MSGLFALIREVTFAYFASSGQPVPPNTVLSVLGHMAIVAFVLSAAAILFDERRQAQSLRTENTQLREEASEALDNFQAQLPLSTLSVLPQAAQLEEARKQFTEEVHRAETGDALALRRCPFKAQRLLEISRAHNASGPAYVADYQRVATDLKRVGATMPRPKGD